MSYYIAFDNHNTSEIATGKGFRDVTDWVEALPVREFPHLTHLILHGFSKDVTAIKREILQAFRRYPVKDAELRSTLRGIIRELERNERQSDIAMITNGMIPVKPVLKPKHVSRRPHSGP